MAESPNLPSVLTDEDRARLDAFDEDARRRWGTALAISVAEKSLETEHLVGLREHLRRELGRVGARLAELDKYLAHDRASLAYLDKDKPEVDA